MKNKIIVVVRGGIVQEVRTDSPENFEVVVLDYDNFEEEEREKIDEKEQEIKDLKIIY